MILYPSFGPGPHVEEVIYSALSAVYKSDIHPTARVVIFTDNPKPFASVRAEVVTIDPLTVPGSEPEATFGCGSTLSIAKSANDAKKVRFMGGLLRCEARSP